MGAHVLAKLREMDSLPAAQEMKLIQGLQVVVEIPTTLHNPTPGLHSFINI